MRDIYAFFIEHWNTASSANLLVLPLIYAVLLGKSDKPAQRLVAILQALRKQPQSAERALDAGKGEDGP